jgi:putative NADH-flavin reductase
MKLTLFGPTGMIGSRILTEALSRGHTLTAITREPSRLGVSHENLEVRAANVLDPDSVAEVIKGQDAVLSAIGSSGSSVEVIAQAARSLVEGLPKGGVHRLVVVGGAGVLEVEPGVQFVDSPNFYEPYRPLALVHREAYNLYKASSLDWTFVCPAAEIAPGERTSQFQVDADRLLMNNQGESRISAEDFAIAFMNEVEQPQFIRQRMSVAY